MSHPSQPTIGGRIALHLLDSAQGQCLQTWRFSDQPSVRIGRGDDNDVIVADPHVSRLHAQLTFRDGSWTLVSHGRHGTLIDDRLVSEAPLTDRIVFRLGPGGPMLRLDIAAALPASYGETIDRIDPNAFSHLVIDENRKQAEVEQIAGNALFEELQQQSRRFKAMRRRDDE